MNDESFEQLEQQIAGAHAVGAPTELRAAVLGGVERELRAVRWDRRLARAAVVLLLVGVGMNVAAVQHSERGSGAARPQIARDGGRQSFVEAAIVVAEATDPVTGGRFARQLAAMSGHDLTRDERAAIEAAMRRRAANGNKG